MDLCHLKVGLRDSLLSRAQLREVEKELRLHYPTLHFEPVYIKTSGDLDKKSSLRSMEKSDFFTREIDERQLQGEFRLSIHSAKDLPDPFRKGLRLGALTCGVDGSDVLLFRDGDNLESLSPHAKVGCSSIRREENVKNLRADLCFVDIRGTIQERLDLLNSGKIDALVVAEAALIRLELTHLNRIKLEGMRAPLQGRLAVIVKEEDEEMITLLKPIHSL